MAGGKSQNIIEDNADIGTNDNDVAASNSQCRDTGGSGSVEHASDIDQYDMICMFTVDQYRQDDPNQAPGNEAASQINVFTVRPQEIWKKFQRYYRIIYLSEEYTLQDDIIIHDPTFAPTYERIARILELRCFKNDHAVLRISKYQFMSEQDPKLASVLGKQRQNLGLGQLSHNEVERQLVATNEMAVINVSVIKRRVDVTHVRPEEGDRVPDSGYWWTHTFDAFTNDFN